MSQSGFNSCAHLVNGDDLKVVNELYDQLLVDGVDPLQKMMDMQLFCQRALADKFPERGVDPTKIETIGDIYEWSRAMDGAIDDERREFYTSLGGMSNGEKAASSVWKHWKAQRDEMQSKKFTDLTESDQLECMFELIDQLHFFMCHFFPLGMTSRDIFVMYYLKNMENLKRYQNNY